MNRRKPERTDQHRRRRRAPILLALGVAMSSCVACSSGSSTSPSSAPTVSDSASASASTTVTTTTPAPTTPVSTATTTSTNPVVDCPVLKAGASPQTPLSCTSATVIGASAARVGLKKDSDSSTIVPGFLLLRYTKTVLLPTGFRREVNIFHYTNGAVPSVLCSGVVAKTLDPALGVCTDVGASTRTDRPAVRAWALRAEAAVSRSAKAQPVLTSGSLTFVACVDPSFPKGGGSIAFQMNIYVQHSGAKTYSSDCNR